LIKTAGFDLKGKREDLLHRLRAYWKIEREWSEKRNENLSFQNQDENN